MLWHLFLMCRLQYAKSWLQLKLFLLRYALLDESRLLVLSPLQSDCLYTTARYVRTVRLVTSMALIDNYPCLPCRPNYPAQS